MMLTTSRIISLTTKLYYTYILFNLKKPLTKYFDHKLSDNIRIYIFCTHLVLAKQCKQQALTAITSTTEGSNTILLALEGLSLAACSISIVWYPVNIWCTCRDSNSW